ncbi:hypothetical protein [Streptomyces griseus]|uniref:hypothetical protein n=1 Tax=Streptomyces griseus TaxID=1911 RepID=UPI0033B7AA7C
MVVHFHGDDDRQKVFDFSTLPLPGWHEPFAAAFASRTGPAGGLRTLASATYSCWNILRRFLIFLDECENSPAVPGHLTAGQMKKFLDHRHSTVGGHAQEEVQALSRLFDLAPMTGLMDPAALDFARRRTQWKTKYSGVGGYSDGEFTRLTAAARTDVAAIRDRITAGEALLERFTTSREPLDEQEGLRGRRLAEMAGGMVPWPSGHASQALRQRKKWASELFFTRDDLAPFMILFVAVTGLNSEAVKELSAEHHMIGDRAVETTVVKRRRGQGRWFTKVTWEIGEPNRQLHTPGGLYLLMLRLTARSRVFAGSSHVLTVWRNSHRTDQRGSMEHYAPFAKSLAAGEPQMCDWSRGRTRPVFADAPDGVEPSLLKIDLNRVRTSVEARRTKQMGGHLPSAARSNSMQVLFRHYLSGDPVIREWADDVLAEALADAEQAAMAAHRRALRKAGGVLRVLTTADAAAPQAEDTAWTACTDMDRHPVTGSPCEVTFLDCFHCGNCLVTRDHLPKLLGLLEALETRRQQMSDADWWNRYGPAWVAIRRDILAKFSPSEVEQARKTKKPDALLDLVENPWEKS